MWSIWNAPSDLDYYGQSGFGEDEPEEEQDEELEPPEYLLDELGLDPGPEPPRQRNLENNNDEWNFAL